MAERITQNYDGSDFALNIREMKSIQTMIQEGAIITTDGSLDYVEPINTLHREPGAKISREYSGGFGY